MNKIKKSLSILLAAVVVMTGALANVTAKAAEVVSPVTINYVGVEHSPLLVGDTETLTVTSAKYTGKVQYAAYLYNGTKWTKLQGYGVAVDSKTPYNLKKTPVFAKAGKNKVSIWVRKAGVVGMQKNVTGDFDSYYVAGLNAVAKNTTRIYTNGAPKVDITGLTVKFNGVENIGGLAGPYLSRLFVMNPRTGVWGSGSSVYAATSSYTFAEPGTYVVVAHINTAKSPTWANYLANNKLQKYAAWKTFVVTVKDSDLPAATVKVEAGLTAFDRYVEVSLDTTNPQDYKVTVLGKELKYVASKKIFQEIITSADEAAIKAGVVVVSTKVVPEVVKATTKVEAGLTAFDRYVEVTLDATKPENYKVTVLGKELKYVADKKIFQEVITSTDETAIKAGVVVTLKK